MKEINPRDDHNPRDWRYAYNEYVKILETGRLLKEAVYLWKLHYPSRLEKIRDNRWRFTYTLSDGREHKTYTVYLGINGIESARTLREVHRGLLQILKTRREAELRSPRAKPTGPLKPLSPVYDGIKARELLDEWNTLMKGVKSTQDYDHLMQSKRFRFLNWFMTRKAGILDMSMRTYLTSHPHAQYWPSAPKDDQEYNNRNRDLQAIIDRKERNRREDEQHDRGY